MTDDVRVFRGRQVVVRLDFGRCRRSRRCAQRLPAVFVPEDASLVVRPDQSALEEILAVARDCPSGAIECEFIEAPDPGPAQRNLNGSTTPEKPRRAVCRCGASKRLPYCDGSHAQVGFGPMPGIPKGAESSLSLRNVPGPIVPRKQRPASPSDANETQGDPPRTTIVVYPRSSRKA